MTSHRRTLVPPDELTLFPMDITWPREPFVLDETPATVPPPGRDRRDVFNARLLTGLKTVGYYGIPKMLATTSAPERLVAFSEAVSRKALPNKGAWVHFYEDDYRFSRFWTNPEKYFDKLAAYGGVISPDHSLYRNMPTAQRISHTYQNQLLGAWLQAAGVDVIANVRLSGPASVPYALAGVPQRSTLAVGLNGCTKDKENREHVIEEIKMIVDLCRPTALVVYGSEKYGVLDYPLVMGVEVHVFKPDTRRRSKSREAA